ncbi:hypothetical protein Dimus_013496 [Dionaea muscipula]
MRDSIEVLRPDLGLSAPSGVDLQQVDGGNLSPMTDWQEGVDAIGCLHLVLGGGTVFLPSADGGSGMDEASKLPAIAGPVNAGDAAALVVGKSQSTLHSLKHGGVGDGVWQPGVVDYGVGGAGGEQEVEVRAGRAALVMPTDLVCSSLPSLYVSADDVIADGFVREEVRALSTAREALSPQPTDGLWQPHSSPMMHVSEREEMEKVVYGGVQEIHTYAHVVHADRRVDVELSFIPPVDSGNSISMEESDGDAERWGSCLVGNFLSCVSIVVKVRPD